MDDITKMKCKKPRDATLCEALALCVKSLRCRTVFAGFIVFFVPFVICESVGKNCCELVICFIKSTYFFKYELVCFLGDDELET